MTAPPHTPKRWATFGALALLAMVVLAYLPVLRHAGFIWDDDAHVTNNPSLRSLEGLERIWSWPLEQVLPGKPRPPATPQYYPLVFTTFWLEWHLWGPWATGYHAVNLLLHAGSAWLLWLALRRLKVPGAWLAAALFALHPVQVETVAWISELKNTLTLFLMLASLLACLKHLRMGEDPKPASPTQPAPRGFYGLALLLFFLAMSAKTVACGLPAVIALILWWKGQFTRRDLLRLAPMVLIGLGMGLLTVWIELRFIGAHGADWDLSLAQRTLIAGRALWFYAAKLVWPVNLTFIYPRWQVDPAALWQWSYPILAALVGLTLLVLGILKKAWRGPAVALAIYAVLMAPALGFVNIFPMRYSFVADHFGYMGTVALMVLAAAGAGRLMLLLEENDRWMAYLAATPVLLVFAVLSWQQGRIYRDQESLWTDTIRKNTKCWMAYENLGMIERNLARNDPDPGSRQARSDNAIRHFLAAIDLRPGTTKGYIGLGRVYADQGKWNDALETFGKGQFQANDNDPDLLDLKTDLALYYNLTGNFIWARNYLETVLAERPRDPAALQAMGNALRGLGQFDEATVYYQRALEISPNNAFVLHDLGVAQLQQDKLYEAKQTFNKALHINKDYAEAYNSYGYALQRSGQLDLAIAHYRKALSLQPKLAEAWANLGTALAAQGKRADALAAYRTALIYNPGMVDVYGQFADLLVASKKPDDLAEALRLAKTACQLSSNRDIASLVRLAKLAADSRDYPLAVNAMKGALDQAHWQNLPDLADQFSKQLEDYRNAAAIFGLTHAPTPK